MAFEATIIRAGDVIYGVVPVPERPTLAIFYRRDEKWWGVDSVHYFHGASALIGEPLPEVVEALDNALLSANIVDYPDQGGPA